MFYTEDKLQSSVTLWGV